MRKNKCLRDLADESGNIKALKLLNKYDNTNEIVCAAFALDCEKVREIVKLGMTFNGCPNCVQRLINLKDSRFLS